MSDTLTASLTAKPFFSTELLDDPYPIYQKFLLEGPIHYLDFRGRGIWTVFGYADCSTAVRDTRFSSRRAEAMLLALSAEQRSHYADLARLLNLWMLFMDAPEHNRLRKLMNKGFSPAVVECLRPRVESLVDCMLEPLRSDCEVDLLKEIAHPLPVRVIAAMLGIQEARQDDLLRTSDAIAAFMGNPTRTEQQVRTAQDAMLALRDFFANAVAERRHHKGSDLISLLLDSEALVGGSEHHSLYANPRQYPQEEQPVLRSRAVHVSTRKQ